MVPEAQDEISLGLNQPRPTIIVRAAVMPSVHFDDELAAVARKVCGEVTDR
jgi:hypothetical protein